MQSKQFWLLILLLLSNYLFANNAEDQIRCERINGVYVLDKKTRSWGCYNLAYSIGDRAETRENRKKCEYDNKLYGWNGSQYDCFFSKKLDTIFETTQTSLKSSGTYQNAVLGHRALCEQNGNAFVWDQEKNEWICQKLLYRTQDRKENIYNKTKCEEQGHRYEWDGGFYCCIDKKTNTNTSLVPTNEKLKLQEKCEKNGDLFRWNDTNNTWECFSMHVANTSNPTLERREKCEKANQQFVWNGTQNEWECISDQTALERDVLEQRKQACLRLENVFEWNKEKEEWECIASAKSKTLSVPVYNEAQEKRSTCEQKGFSYLWNGTNNEWECFKSIDSQLDSTLNITRKEKCSSQGDHYLEIKNDQWACMEKVAKPQTQKLDLSSPKAICAKYNGSLVWQNYRWMCTTSSTKEEIEKASFPTTDSAPVLTPPSYKFQIDQKKSDEILSFDFSKDGKYLSTYSVNSKHYIAKVYSLFNMNEIYSINLDKNNQAMLHQTLLFIYGHSRSDFEVIDMIQNKRLLLLPNANIRQLAMTDDDHSLVLIDHKNNLSVYDTSSWKLRYTIQTQRVHLNYNALLDSSKPFFYENSDGQKSALHIHTGENILPLPQEPSKYRYQYEYEAAIPTPKSLPQELNATKNKLYFSTDLHYAIEVKKDMFAIWDLQKSAVLATHQGQIINLKESIKTSATHAIFHASIGTRSTFLIDFKHPDVLNQLTYSTERPQHYRQDPKSRLLNVGGKIAWNLQNAHAVATEPIPYNFENMQDLKYFSDGKRIVFGQSNQAILYDTIQKKELARFGGGKWTHETTSTQIELSPDESKIIATANHERDIMVWDINQSKLDYTIPNPSGWGNRFSLSKDGKHIIALSYSPTDGEAHGLGYHPYQGDINIWNFKTGTLERTLPKRATTFALIPDTYLIALGEMDGTVSLWDYRSGLERYRLIGHDKQIQSLIPIRNGHSLLSRDASGRMIRWDYLTSEPVGTKTWYKAPYKSLLAHDAKWMLDLNYDYKKQSSIRLLNLLTSNYDYEFFYPISYATRASLSFDERSCFLSNLDNSTTIFDTKTGKELGKLYAYQNGEWIIMTPQGYFNASQKGRDFIIDASGNSIDDATYKHYFNPELVKEILNPKGQ